MAELCDVAAVKASQASEQQAQLEKALQQAQVEKDEALRSLAKLLVEQEEARKQQEAKAEAGA